MPQPSKQVMKAHFKLLSPAGRQNILQRSLNDALHLAHSVGASTGDIVTALVAVHKVWHKLHRGSTKPGE